MRRFAALLLSLLLLAPAAGAAGPPVTRAGFVCALWEGAGGVPYDANGPFSDVPRDGDGATAVAWAWSLGLVKGTGGGCFSPARPITREEAAVLLRRYAAYLGRDTFLPGGLAACNDYEGISPWADDSLYWATDCGLIGWSPGGLLDPGGTLSDGEPEEILARFFDLPPAHEKGPEDGSSSGPYSLSKKAVRSFLTKGCVTDRTRFLAEKSPCPSREVSFLRRMSPEMTNFNFIPPPAGGGILRSRRKRWFFDTLKGPEDGSSSGP